MSARGLYQSSFWFVPQSTLVFYTNSMPNVKLGDTAMRERLCRVKFDQHLPSTLTALGRAPVPDYHRVVLESEGPAIVASLVDRAIRVIQEISTGTFAVPDSVKAATSIMLDQADPLSQFVSDVFESDAENSPGKAQWWPVRVLYDQLYLPYCNRQGHAPYRFAGFGKAFENRHPAPSERRRLDSGSRVMCRYLVLTEEGENLMRASISTSFDEYTELNTL
jgi:phage/plasmid-associated DNA primase